MNQDFWKSLQLPLNLFNLVQKKIVEFKEKSSVNNLKNENIKIEKNIGNNLIIKNDFNDINSNVKPSSQGNQMIDDEEDPNLIKDNLKILIFDLCFRVMTEITKKEVYITTFKKATSNHFKYNSKPKR